MQGFCALFGTARVSRSTPNCTKTTHIPLILSEVQTVIHGCFLHSGMKFICHLCYNYCITDKIRGGIVGALADKVQTTIGDTQNVSEKYGNSDFAIFKPRFFVEGENQFDCFHFVMSRVEVPSFLLLHSAFQGSYRKNAL